MLFLKAYLGGMIMVFWGVACVYYRCNIVCLVVGLQEIKVLRALFLLLGCYYFQEGAGGRYFG